MTTRKPLTSKLPFHRKLASVCDGRVRLERLPTSGIISARAWIQGRDIRKSTGSGRCPQPSRSRPSGGKTCLSAHDEGSKSTPQPLRTVRLSSWRSGNETRSRDSSAQGSIGTCGRRRRCSTHSLGRSRSVTSMRTPWNDSARPAKRIRTNAANPSPTKPSRRTSCSSTRAAVRTGYDAGAGVSTQVSVFHRDQSIGASGATLPDRSGI